MERATMARDGRFADRCDAGRQLGHSVVARRHGVEIEEVDLWLLGGVARMKG